MVSWLGFWIEAKESSYFHKPILPRTLSKRTSEGNQRAGLEIVEVHPRVQCQNGVLVDTGSLQYCVESIARPDENEALSAARVVGNAEGRPKLEVVEVQAGIQLLKGSEWDVELTGEAAGCVAIVDEDCSVAVCNHFGALPASVLLRLFGEMECRRE